MCGTSTPGNNLETPCRRFSFGLHPMSTQQFCNLIHDIAASECPLQGCDMCLQLADPDGQITAAHNHLISLVQKRMVMKSGINTRHDRMSSKLPVEIVSRIFSLIVNSSSEHSECTRIRGSIMRPPILLGVVCKGWRQFTLGTPELWSSITVNLITHAGVSLASVKEWLRRSGTTPISLTHFRVTSHEAASPYFQ